MKNVIDAVTAFTASYSQLTQNAVTGIVAVGFIVYVVNKKNNKKKTKRTVPYAEDGFFSTIAAFAGTDLPWFFVRNGKTMKKKYNGLLNFRLQFPIPGGWYVLGDTKLTKRIWLNPSSDKATKLYQPIAQALGSNDNIFTAPNNAHWKMVRKTSAPAFSSTELTSMKQVVTTIVQQWCIEKQQQQQQVQTADDHSIVLDPTREMVMITFKTICMAGLEYDASEKEFDEFSKNLALPLQEVIAQITNPFRPYLQYFIPKVRESIECSKRLKSFAQYIIQNYRSRTDTSSNDKNNRDSNTNNNNSLIKLLVGNDDFSSDDQRASEVLLFLIAGHDTTGMTLSSTLVLLAKHPHVLTKLYNEARNIPIDKWSSMCLYYKYIIKESMRLVPVAPLAGSRITSQEYYVNDTFVIPKGATVSNAHIVSLYDEAIFGPTVHEFNPDRWYSATTEMNNCIMPFSVGIRNCIGQSLANIEIDIVLPIILSTFDIKLVQEGTLQYFTTLKYLNAQIQFIPKKDYAKSK